VKRGALEHFHDQVWVSFDPDEKTLPAMVELLGDDRFVWASDYPHFDATFPGATREIREVIAPLAEESQRRILGENARRLYGI
jgi:predicted TIM-barrel fold metal-dependent hydrolase